MDKFDKFPRSIHAGVGSGAGIRDVEFDLAVPFDLDFDGLEDLDFGVGAVGGGGGYSLINRRTRAARSDSVMGGGGGGARVGRSGGEGGGSRRR